MPKAILGNHQAMKSFALSFMRLDSVSLVWVQIDEFITG